MCCHSIDFIFGLGVIDLVLHRIISMLAYYDGIFDCFHWYKLLVRLYGVEAVRLVGVGFEKKVFGLNNSVYSALLL